MAATAIVVLVPELEPLVGRFRAIHAEDAASGMPPHVTLLYPFLHPDLLDVAVDRAVADVVGGFEPFRFVLGRIGRFPGVLYLAPEPADRFLALTEALRRRWPAIEPYGGAFPTLVPHLTVTTGPAPAALAAALERALPVEATATVVSLMTSDRRGRWSTRNTFPLGDRSGATVPLGAAETR
jgi:2'-5' RNA ligase